jgi:signal transduction histidine kinase
VFFRQLRGWLDARLSIHLQIFLDWLALTVLCHLTGGVDSPFILFFLLHVVLSSIVVSRWECFLQGILAIVMVNGMALMETMGVWPLPGFPGVPVLPHYENPSYLLIFLLSFNAIILFIIYLSTFLVQQLRRREAKLMELQENLRRAYDDVVEMDEAKTRFVRIVSHEIRAPLAASQSLLKVVLEGYAGDMSEKARELLGRADHRIMQLIEFINELLDLARGSQRLPEEDKHDILVYESITRIVKETEAKITEKGLRLDIQIEHPHVIFRGDLQDLERIFHNLLGNAIKYTPEGGKIAVIGTLLADNFFLFRICDTGIGIPAEELPRVFDEFFRASNAKKELKTGTGLGLSIVKKTVEKYGGRVEATSEIGRGTCFSVFLPVIALDHCAPPSAR